MRSAKCYLKRNMKRRSVKPGYLILGGFLLLIVLAFFTRILIPYERFSINVVGAALFRYGEFADFLSPAGERTPSGEWRVVGKRADEFSDILLIYPKAPLGKRVLAGDKVLVGTVVEAGSSASRVQLISSPLVKTAAVFGRSGIPVTLEGKGAGLLDVRLPRGVDIQMGDTAYVDDGDILIVGGVIRIIDMPGDPLITVLVGQPVNLTTLASVTIHGF